MEIDRERGIVVFDSQHERLVSMNYQNLNIYVCGPTVYTHTHLGHLKTYMSFDIIRRILTDYLKLDVHYMMNITNIDDKIIKATYQEKYGADVVLSDLTESQYLPDNAFREYADKWESSFFENMDLLNIRRPDILSRVTDYIPEILSFVDKIYQNGFAFEHDGSVYFYGTKYNYITNGDDEIFSKDPTSKYNFVLLKKAKPYEPCWESKWGKIRPGWHIECSAMASDIFGYKIDIHGGGIDLKFPHHHNEVQQSEARFFPFEYTEELSWVKIFMHTGHLNIKGLKMSRSLKNFVTVAQALEDYDATELRVLFCLFKWNRDMDYSADTMADAKYHTKQFRNFNTQINSVLLDPICKPHKKFTQCEKKFTQQISTAKLNIDLAFRDNFNVPNAMKAISELMSITYAYIKNIRNTDNILCSEILLSARETIFGTLSLLGLSEFEFNSNSNFPNKNNSDNTEKFLSIIARTRTEIRENALKLSKINSKYRKTLGKQQNTNQTMAETMNNLSCDTAEVAKDLFKLTDDIRDNMLPQIGIQLTDAQNSNT